MVLETKQTTVAYRCPHCGNGVISAVNPFLLKGAMLRLKCDCGESFLEIQPTTDGKFRLSVPCILCPTPHYFTVSENLFYNKDLFALPCPYTDLNVCVMGELNHVKAELSRTELALMDLMEEHGIENFDRFHSDEEALPDPQILEIVMFVIHDLDAEGKIYCRCDPTDNERSYDAEVREDGILVRCRKCGAERLIPTDSRLGAHAFLNADSLHLE